MNRIFSILWLLCPVLLIGQIEQHLVIAENGDGIFSILRKQGLNPAKYYAEFVELNKENLRNGSELHLGRAYIIPYAEDSFKKTAVQVKADGNVEESIFKSELAQISPKSTKLKNAVIYLISGNNPAQTSNAANKITNEITLNLAQELMVHGAQVYLIQSETENKDLFTQHTKNTNTEGAMADLSQMQEYVEIINKKYLKHQGKYQRLLITRVNNVITDTHCEVSVFHHNSSENGRRIASNIQQVFNENSIESKPFKEYTEIFTDKNNLYLAKNALPAITLIEIDSGEKPTIEDVILVNSNQELLSNLIISGVLNDYADLEIEK
ncbi:N-acetylmuramoyl-L-alanine amidase [Croceitalea sp. MTPC9]|uniref:hypothetical protein n=1 Tax=unclassified Croceitalea TaxID=2632280 RepID=UPI002B38815B|nr:N-acetylmuramoyl-L-alanine amidase [Croceitalea sp. MTPC6]GMN17039.1 N-acetylmuramoyl-L-alanine amidase [Croceitalea sp. MTPC9]